MRTAALADQWAFASFSTSTRNVWEMASGRLGFAAPDAGCGLKSAVGKNSTCSLGSAAIVRPPYAVATVAIVSNQPPSAVSATTLIVPSRPLAL